MSRDVRRARITVVYNGYEVEMLTERDRYATGDPEVHVYETFDNLMMGLRKNLAEPAGWEKDQSTTARSKK